MVENLWVRYRATPDSDPTLKGTALRLVRGKRAHRTIEALRGVSFSVPRGTVLGIVGNNGAGKSTLLRTVAGIVGPTAGRVMVRGRVATLLALGIGFNRELSGRDNVYLGGLAAGLSLEELRARFDEIADFSDLGEFIDYPMRMYSTGMYGRLAFAVAVNVEPQVLLIDEALTAGDAAFKVKCEVKVQQLCAENRTILLVSHGMKLVKELAQQGLWLHQGQIKMMGESDEVVDAFTSSQQLGAHEAMSYET